ncbi:MAG TPA: hypothetical protein VFN09_11855 [Rhodanobacteraceae bacterium]|nr:hypothetical protein [Rhodanobacteraceae bacterium]
MAEARTGLRRAVRGAALVLALLASSPLLAGLPGWLQRERDEPPAPLIEITGATGAYVLAPGKQVRVQIGSTSPVASVDGASIRYQRIKLPTLLKHARIEVRVTTQRHKTSPRFTILAPQAVLLDGDGEIVAVRPLQPLALDIEPFRRTQLHGCIEVDNLAGFLLATDPSRVGDRYEFEARPKPGSHPDRGFYSARSTMRVFMRYADSGELLLRVVDADATPGSCQSESAG